MNGFTEFRLVEFFTGKKHMLGFVIEEKEDKLIILPLQSKRRRNGWKRVNSDKLGIPSIKESFIDATTFWEVETSRITKFNSNANMRHLDEFHDIRIFIRQNIRLNPDWFYLISIGEDKLIKTPLKDTELIQEFQYSFFML